MKVKKYNMKRKYYMVSLIYNLYHSEEITVKARNEKQAILKALKLLKYREKHLVKISNVKEINIFECLEKGKKNEIN